MGIREIEFRGKDIDTGKWVYGSYFEHKKVNLCIASESEIIENTQHLIVRDKIACDWGFENGIQCVDINPKTVGQYIRQKDINRTKIFEGDIVRIYAYNYDSDVVYQVKYDEYTASFVIEGNDLCVSFDNVCGWEVEVIGNIYDNPELLEGL